MKLPRNKLPPLIALGVFFWFLAAVVIRFEAPHGFFSGWMMGVQFLVAVPSTWANIRFVKSLVRLKKGEILDGVLVMLVTSIFLEGIAFTWFKGLYGSDPALILQGATWLLWGVGVATVLGWIADSI